MEFIAPVIGGLVLYFIISMVVKAPGAGLQSQFVALGTLKGKSYSEIVKAVGNPSSISNKTNDDGEPIKIVQWIATGYHIVLLFDNNDICLGVSSETKV